MSLEQKNIVSFMDVVISKYHFDESDRDELMRVYEQMQICMSPYAVYKINQRVTGIKEIDDSQSAIVAMTLGAGIDKLSDRYEREGELSAAYMLDCISNELLMKMYVEFNSSYAKFHRRYVTKYHFLGNDIGLDKVRNLLEVLNGKASETTEKLIDDDNITANEYGVLFPAKSVIFYAILSENPDSVCEGICVGCGNPNCENRMKYTQTEHIAKKVMELIESKEKTDKSNVAYNYGYQRIFGS